MSGSAGCAAEVMPSANASRVFSYALDSHTAAAFTIMNEMRLSQQLCDVTLKVKYKDLEEEIMAHKIVLASCSPVFRAMFTAGLRERGMEVIPIEGIHPKVMQRLVEFAYTASITVGEKCVLHVMTGAVMYQMDSVVQACCDFLVEQLDPSNAIGFAAFAEEIGCQELSLKAREYIYLHFSEVAKQEEFFNLTQCQLVSLISRDELNVRCESEVYHACIQWVKYECESRRPYIHALLNAVRCHSLTPNFLQTQLQKCEILRMDSKCKDYLVGVFKELTLHKPTQGCPCRSPKVSQLIYSAGGYFRQSLSYLEAYNPLDARWVRLADMPVPRSGLATCTVNGLLYVVGGRNNSPDGNTDSNALDCYNPMNNMWSACAPLHLPRNRVGGGVIDGMIYAVGGSEGCSHHSTVERYDPEKDQWEFVAAMSTSRIGVGVAIANRLLYAIGGFDGTSRLNSAERYYPEDNKWETIGPMNTVRSGAGVCNLRNCVYAIGGYDGVNQLNSVERYEIENGQWTCIAPMKHKRSALGVTVYQGKIYVLGGYDGQDFLSSVECFDPDTGQWTEVTQMTSGRSGVGVAVTLEPCRLPPL
ncbi:kelch-like ECH-associated protein 1B [Callorhinchus milii]|uniref:Kelch-like ECH-associated protein 1b n=1 Tax=Callorhinchus milii TaxID=7868 RepID=A0A4W3IJE1_CALMI|nr:kelch-like ECH-associated protein 1B [Callorhinchus milii]XP_007907176.1 kelch-like ECH-associated protein 1B [Callorhinchus milii]XP_042191699.1 kelch-like ECH-associated protein 1B [Callorhinchus milii]XP_042191700.1 kelch-like ECH-associated protein 1B [Callorhinchus milii]|eukprot:gi/632980690/ref/XP_007907175.1/ PREDICTED: kelch-like ECH-associated protein 1 [Callorhinchus milii]